MRSNPNKGITVRVGDKYYCVYGGRLLVPVSIEVVPPVDLNPSEYEFPSLDSPELLKLLQTIETFPGGLDPQGKTLLAEVMGNGDHE
jgi:hypothetical protein